MTYKIKAHHFVVKSAFDFYIFSREFYQILILKGCCQHYHVHFEFIRPCDVRCHQDSDLDRAVENTQKLYSVHNTEEPLQLKVRSVPCLCPSCIRDDGRKCENAAQTDPWRIVTLIPPKGANKNKYKKWPRPDQKIVQNQENERNDRSVKEIECESQNSDADSEATFSYNGMDPSDDEEEDELTFEIPDEEEDIAGKKKTDKKNIEGKQIVKDSSKSDKHVTDSVTDSETDKRPANDEGTPKWVPLSEEITEQDFITPESSQSSDLQIIDVCNRTSKEFELASENILTTNACNSQLTGIFTKNLPYTVLWSSILTAMHECKDFKSLVELCKQLKEEMPPVENRVKALFLEKYDTIDKVAQSKIPVDGPKMLKAAVTTADGNCLG